MSAAIASKVVFIDEGPLGTTFDESFGGQLKSPFGFAHSVLLIMEDVTWKLASTCWLKELASQQGLRLIGEERQDEALFA